MTELNLKVGTEYHWMFPNKAPARVRLLQMLPRQASIKTEGNAFPGVDDLKERCEVEIITPEQHRGETRDVDADELRAIEKSE